MCGASTLVAACLKRGADVVVAAVALVLLAPLLVVLGLIIRADSPGPAWFSQTRIGRGGVPFTLYKLRSMRVDAVTEVPSLRARNEADGPLFKLRRDPRVTRVGRWLRATSLDEIPQLVNVLQGRMSLVGPRPALPEEVARYDRRARARLTVRPGLTGPWQVSGRSDLSWEAGLGLDLAYAAAPRIRTDVAVLARTLPALITARGAY